MWTLCEKTNQGKADSIIFIIAFSSFVSVKPFLKMWANHFSLLTFESFKPSLPLFLTIDGKRYLDLFFSLSARFEQFKYCARTFHFQILISFFTLFLSFTVYLLARFRQDRCFRRTKTFTWERRDLWRYRKGEKNTSGGCFYFKYGIHLGNHCLQIFMGLI